MKAQLILNLPPKKLQTSIYIDSKITKTPLFLKRCHTLSSRFALITNYNLGNLYGKSLMTFLQKEGFDVTLHLFKGGEKHKNRKVKEEIEESLFRAGHGRDSAIIAMGGGVALDLIGFVAATFCRGIPFLSIPTSLLSMVDASIGGKTGVNIPFGKNLIGSMYFPHAIFIDLSFLDTLPEKAIREGSSEIVKYGLIANSHLFYQLSNELDLWEKRDLPFLKNLIHESCSIKKKVVEADMNEEGMRRMLNFGHTIAHAIETLENYEISHGEALAIGIIVESLISLKMESIREKEFDQIYHLFKAMRFNLSISPHLTSKALLDSMRYDKKTLKGTTPRFVILNRIGSVKSCKGAYCTEIDPDLLNEVLGWMIAEFMCGA